MKTRLRGVRVLLLAALLALASPRLAMTSAAALATRPAQAIPFPTVRALAAAGGALPVYLANASGLYRTAGGSFAIWTRMSMVGAIVAISVNGQAPDDLVYATSDGALYRSTDGGRTAAQTAHGLGVDEILRAAGNPSVLYAVGSTNTGGVIYTSSDDGASWHLVYTTPDVSPGISAITTLVVDPANAAHLLAGEQLYHAGALIESHDSGATWHDLPSPAEVGLAAPVTVAIDPLHPSSVWACWSLMGYASLYYSADGGQTWQALSPAAPPSAVTTAIAFDRMHARTYLAVADERSSQTTQIYMTADNGVHFARFAPNLAGFGRDILVLSAQGELVSGDAATPLTITAILPDGSAGTRTAPQMTGTPLSTPVVSLYLGSADGSLYALDARTGQYRWSVHTGGPVSSPAVFSGLVYAGSFDGTLYALADGDGSMRWRFHTGGAVGAPVLAGGLVVIASRDGNLYALDVVSGRLRWRQHVGNPDGQPIAADGWIFAAATDHQVYALDARTGAVRWRYRGRASGVPVSLRAGMGRVYVGTSDGTVIALKQGNGELLWRFQSGTPNSLPSEAVIGSLSSGLLYAGADHAIYALEAPSGAVRWRFATGATVQCAPAVAAGLVYAGSWDTDFYALDARTGMLRWRFKGPQAIYGSPAVADGTAFIGYADHNVYALDARTGHRLWSFYGDATYTTPAVETPADPVLPELAGSRYFPATSHTLSGAFLDFWQRYGGLTTFGYPLTEPYTEHGDQVQYMERFALILHAGSVSILPLGTQLTTGRSFPPIPSVHATPSLAYFPATGHSLSGRFLSFWRTHHGDILLGPPIAEVTRETNGDGSGRIYQVQWFQRGRLEYHPELAGTRYEVELGLLGLQALQAQGWLP